MASYSTSQKRRAFRPADNFLEALRDLGKGVVNDVVDQAKITVTSDIPQSFGLSGSLEPNQSFSVGDLKKAEQTGEARAESRFNDRLSRLSEEHRTLFLRQEAEVTKQIQSIQNEIALLAKSTGELVKEVQVAAIQAPVNPGVYHQNFFEHLRSIIKSLRLKAQDGKNWLASFNSRSSKRGYYWGQVAKSGSKFTLSQERYAVMSTG